MQVHAHRRRELAERMRRLGGGVAVLATAPEVIRNRDAHYPYRSDSYFHYLTGFPEPEAVLVLIFLLFTSDAAYELTRVFRGLLQYAK